MSSLILTQPRQIDREDRFSETHRREQDAAFVALLSLAWRRGEFPGQAERDAA